MQIYSAFIYYEQVACYMIFKRSKDKRIRAMDGLLRALV